MESLVAVGYDSDRGKIEGTGVGWRTIMCFSASCRLARRFGDDRGGDGERHAAFATQGVSRVR